MPPGPERARGRPRAKLRTLRVCEYFTGCPGGPNAPGAGIGPRSGRNLACIRFDHGLQPATARRRWACLCPGGFLVLGSRERLSRDGPRFLPRAANGCILCRTP